MIRINNFLTAPVKSDKRNVLMFNQMPTETKIENELS